MVGLTTVTMPTHILLLWGIFMPGPAPARFEMRTLQAEDAIVVKCRGRLTAEFTSAFKAEVKPLIPQARRLILDFTDVKHLDSAGLGAVVGLYVSARNAHCELRMVNLSPRVRELLGLTHLLSALEACGQYMIKLP